MTLETFFVVCISAMVASASEKFCLFYFCGNDNQLSCSFPAVFLDHLGDADIISAQCIRDLCKHSCPVLDFKPQKISALYFIDLLIGRSL